LRNCVRIHVAAGLENNPTKPGSVRSQRKGQQKGRRFRYGLYKESGGPFESGRFWERRSSLVILRSEAERDPA